jgi:Glycosyltransferase family 87
VDGTSGLARSDHSTTFIRVAALAAGAVCLVGVAVVVAAASIPGTADHSPLEPPGHWETAIVVAMIAAVGAYAAGLLLLARVQVSTPVVIGLAVAIQLIPLSGPLLLATDAASYVEYGRSSHPYSGPEASVYGPLWTIISVPFSYIGNGVYAMRVIGAASALALVWLAWLLAGRKALAVAVVGWNPLVALQEAGGGHNDALMMVFVLGALVLARKGYTRLGGAAWVASVAVKWSSAPLYLLWAIEERRRHRSSGLSGGLICGALILVASFLSYGTGWLHVFSALSHQSSQATELGVCAWLVGLGVDHHVALHLTYGAEIIALGVFAVYAWYGRLRLGLAALVWALLTTRLNAWYAIWGISLTAADDEDRWGRVLAVGMTGYLLADAITTYADVQP